MKLHRFFVDEKLQVGEFEISNEELIHQVSRVLRMKKGDELILFDGSGSDFRGEITELSKKEIRVQLKFYTAAWIPKKKVTLFMATIRKELFELVIEKATELGISGIVPLESERTERGVVSNRRAEKIMKEASEQCGRGSVPIFEEPMKLREALTQEGVRIICDKHAEPISKVIVRPDIEAALSINIFIGPEGGWGDLERELFSQKHVCVVALGPTTLRAETAAIVACAHFLEI